MIVNATGAFVIPWLDCMLDGTSGAPMTDLEPGVHFGWRGTPLRLDGPQSILPLGHSLDNARNRRKAGWDDDDRAAPPLTGAGFAVTDGRKIWSFSLIPGLPGRGPLCLTLDGAPPATRALWVTHCTGLRPGGRVAPPIAKPCGVVCFTPGALIATPDGPRPVEHIAEGDRINTKDNGPQEVLWRAERQLSGAGLHAQPSLAPVRLRRSALGVEIPDQALLVSPDHRVVLRGPRARALFNCDEVLVTARDLIDGSAITRVTGLRRLRYIHLAMERHQVVFANGVETESFDPAATALDQIAKPDRARLFERLPDLAQDRFGAPARRVLGAGEASILRRDAGLH